VKSSNDLSKVQDEGVILGLLQGAKEKNCEIFVWRFLGGEKHLGLTRIESVRKLRGDFCIVPHQGQERVVQDLIGSLNFIDLYIPEYCLLLRCDIKQTDAPQRYYLKIPDFVAQVERRKAARLNTEDDSTIKVEFSKFPPLSKGIKQQFSKKCFDLSSGGLSFYTSRQESKFFKPGDIDKELHLRAGDISLSLDGEVTSVIEVVPDEFNGLSYKVWRVSYRFLNIDQISQRKLERFIFQRIKEELHVING
jgi:hypothetical protein